MSEAGETKQKHPRCKGTRKDGQPCQAPALDAGFCFAHDPGRKAERDAARSRGGRNRSNVVRLRGLVPPRLQPVFDLLEDALSEVHTGTLAPSKANAMANIARAMVSVLQAGELEERLRNIEDALEQGESNAA